MTGYVIRKYQVEGDYVEEGARLYNVADLESVWIQAQVYENDLGFLRVGQEVSATAAAFPGDKFDGTLRLIQPQLERSSRTVMVRFDMPNPERKPAPGMYTTVTLKAPATEPKLAVPERAVIDTGSRKVVYREYEPNKYEGVLVELGPRMAGPDRGVYYPVVRGLETGNKIVATGSFSSMLKRV